MRISPVFDQLRGGVRLRQFGLTQKGVLRQPFQSVQKRLQLPILVGSGFVEGRYFSCQLNVDGFACSLISPFEVRSMAFGGVVPAGAGGFAALHHPLEHAPLAEVPESLELPF